MHKILFHPYRPNWKPSSVRVHEAHALAKWLGANIGKPDANNKPDVAYVIGHRDEGLNKHIADLQMWSTQVVWLASDPAYTAIPKALWPEGSVQVLHTYDNWGQLVSDLGRQTDWWLPVEAEFCPALIKWNQNRQLAPDAEPQHGLVYVGYPRTNFRAERISQLGATWLDSVPCAEVLYYLNGAKATLVTGDKLYRCMPYTSPRLLQAWASSTIAIVDEVVFGECPYQGLEALWVRTKPEVQQLMHQLGNVSYRLKLIAKQSQWLKRLN